VHDERPKTIAPTVKMVAPIQMIMVALFSEMFGAGFITKENRGAIILFPYDAEP
jgi:hypothetical protein